MHLVLQNIKKVLKPNGYVLFRDYAVGDLAQERFIGKDQKISENFYVRGDGTRAFYFSDEFLTRLFEENEFEVKNFGVCCKQVENRSRDIVMNRRWMQAVFRSLNGVNPPSTDPVISACEETIESDIIEDILKKPEINNFEVDMSETFAIEMFGIESQINEIIELKLRDHSFKINVLPKECQHTCKSTGLMLWESARLMASILSENPNIVAGKRVLELGSGCGGICSMIAAKSANLVIATDGDTKALEMLIENISLNLSSSFSDKLISKKLEWGNSTDIKGIKELNNEGFEVIIRTDVTYVSEAILPLFATAKELISSKEKAALILCHVFRLVDEQTILSAASHYGFSLVDKWPLQNSTSSSQGIISSWFSKNDFADLEKNALNIMYFQLE